VFLVAVATIFRRRVCHGGDVDAVWSWLEAATELAPYCAQSLGDSEAQQEALAVVEVLEAANW
jgi:hypothetical protein